MEGRGVRIEVEDGSKPAVEGVIRALRFWVMLSSIDALDMRRKSAEVIRCQGIGALGIEEYLVEQLSRNRIVVLTPEEVLLNSLLDLPE